MSVLTNYFNDIVESVDPYHEDSDSYGIEYDLFMQDMIYKNGEWEDTRTCELLESYLYETESDEFEKLIEEGKNLYNEIKYNKLGVA